MTTNFEEFRTITERHLTEMRKLFKCGVGVPRRLYQQNMNFHIESKLSEFFRYGIKKLVKKGSQAIDKEDQYIVN